MGNTLIRLERDTTEYFLQWSSIVDAPISYGMSESELREFYLEEYGRNGSRDLDERIAECRKRGTSSRMDKTAESVIRGNRAGEDETELSVDQIIDCYCIAQDDSRPPHGVRRDDYGNVLTEAEYVAWAEAGFPDTGAR